jgi:hypothetical protein
MDDLVGVACDCARAIHGDHATLSFEQAGPAYPSHVRWCASVRVRGVVVESKHAATHCESVRALACDLSKRSRALVDAHREADFRALTLGL